MRGARQRCGHNPGYMWGEGQDQTGVEMGSAAKPKNARILNFSRERQKILKLRYADFFYKRPGRRYFRLCGSRVKIKDIMHLLYNYKYRPTSFYCALLYCVFYKLKVCGNPPPSKLASFFPWHLLTVCLCHIFVILMVFQTFSLVLDLLW